jgi:hypothetical protein
MNRSGWFLSGPPRWWFWTCTLLGVFALLCIAFVLTHNE